MNENDTPVFIPSLKVTETLYDPEWDIVGLIEKVDPEKTNKPGRPDTVTVTGSKSTSVVVGNV